MATALIKPVTREIILGDETYKVVITTESVKVTRKGRRRGAELKWDAVLALGNESEPAEPPKPARTSDVPTAIAADLAKEVRTAADALSRARDVLARVGTLPAALLAEVEPDPIYGRAESQTDWYIEPLLTPPEVASLLRISRAAVSRLGIPSVNIAGERRYRQSELRRYLANHESRY
jgi:hypothetical protein